MGFIKNDADGSVLIEAEGEEQSLECFLTWCAHGPKGVEVTKIHNESGQAVGYSGFEIR